MNFADKPLPEDFGTKLRDWRQRAGLTQEELARVLGVTFSTVNRWENNHVQPSELARRAIREIVATRALTRTE